MLKMRMDIKLEPLSESHRHAVMDIYNHYVRVGFASYREIPLPYEAFDRFLAMAKGYPAYASIGAGGRVNGFAFLHAWHPSECFARTAELTYFLHPDATRQGIGTLFMDLLQREAKAMGIDNVLACISSRNEQSLSFHRKHGFTECGHFPGIGRKHGEEFGVVWMMKHWE